MWSRTQRRPDERLSATVLEAPAGPAPRYPAVIDFADQLRRDGNRPRAGPALGRTGQLSGTGTGTGAGRVAPPWPELMSSAGLLRADRPGDGGRYVPALTHRAPDRLGQGPGRSSRARARHRGSGPAVEHAPPRPYRRHSVPGRRTAGWLRCPQALLAPPRARRAPAQREPARTSKRSPNRELLPQAEHPLYEEQRPYPGQASYQELSPQVERQAHDEGLPQVGASALLTRSRPSEASALRRAPTPNRPGTSRRA